MRVRVELRACAEWEWEGECEGEGESVRGRQAAGRQPHAARNNAGNQAPPRLVGDTLRISLICL